MQRCFSLARPLFSESVIPRPSEILLCRAIGNVLANVFLEGNLAGSSRAKLVDLHIAAVTAVAVVAIDAVAGVITAAAVVAAAAAVPVAAVVIVTNLFSRL